MGRAEVVLVQGQLCVSGACSGAGLGAACCLFVRPCLVQWPSRASQAWEPQFLSLPACVWGDFISFVYLFLLISVLLSLLITVPVLALSLICFPSPPFFRPFTLCALHEQSQLALTIPAEASLWLGQCTYHPALPTTHPHALFRGHSAV